MTSLPSLSSRVVRALVLVGVLTLASCSNSGTESPAANEAMPADTATSVAPPTTEVADYDFSEVSPLIEDFIEQEDLNGAGLIVVERDDGVVHEEYWGEFDADRTTLIASSGKMIVAGVLLKLHDDGVLDINAPVADVVPWGQGNPDVTPAQLLSNSSGLVGLLPNPAYVPYVCQFLSIGSLQRCGESIFTTAADDGDVVPPDTEFRYGGGQWQVAEAASGKSWAELIDETYVEPCDLDVLGFNNHFAQLIPATLGYPTDFGGDPSTLAATENPNIEGGGYTTMGDYAQLLLMHLRDGRCGDEQVLSPDALDLMHADRIGEIYGGEAQAGTGYGMGWWIDRDTGRLTDPGAYGATSWLDLDDGYGAYLVLESDGLKGAELAGLVFEPLDDAMNDARG